MKSIVAVVIVSALVASGCGGSSGENDATTTNQGGAQAGQGQGPGGGIDTAALASALGVSQDKVERALAKAFPQGQGRPGGQAPPDGQVPPNGTPPPNFTPGAGAPRGAGGPGGMIAKRLADELGLPEAKVQKALAKALPQRPPGP